jgi:type II secretory pathway pseudopilin PulG
MNKGFTLVELIISLGVLVLSVVVLVGLSVSYLSILNTIRTRYLALNIAQEGIELAIALRNKQIETGSQPWSGVSNAGKYCLIFSTSTQRIIVESSSQPCPTGVSDYRRLIYYSDFENPGNTNLENATATRVISEVYFGKDNIQLDVVLTKWHPHQ